MRDKGWHAIMGLLSSRNLLYTSIALTICNILFFSSSAFRIDDPLFIWSAQSIINTPLDPLGHVINWYGFNDNAFYIHQNPPLVSYFIAVVILIAGLSEPSLHIAFLIPTIVTLLCVYKLAENIRKETGGLVFF